MAWTPVDTNIVRVKCSAPEAANSRRPESADGRCNYVIGDLPGPLRAIGTRGSIPDRPDGRIWIHCTRCRTWNVFEQGDG